MNRQFDGIYSGITGKVPGWRSAVGLYCKFNQCAVYIDNGALGKMEMEGSMNKEIKIGNHVISEDSPAFIVAEMSANHNMDFERAVSIMQAAKKAGDRKSVV